MVREEPAKRTTTIETEVYIPAFHAVIISLAWALAAAILASFIAALAQLSLWYVPAAFLAVATFLFPFQVTHNIKDQRKLLWKWEETEHQEPNNDSPIETTPTFTVELVTRDSSGQLRNIHTLDFGVPDEQALAFIRGVLDGRPITETQWTGNGRPFSKTKYNPMRDGLIAKGILQWRNPDAPAQGVELTDKGRTVFEQLAAQNA